LVAILRSMGDFLAERSSNGFESHSIMR